MSQQDDVLPGPPVMSWRLDFCVQGGYHVSGFSGSAWRGVFGLALKQRLCLEKAGGAPCRACHRPRTCDYAALFEPLPPSSASLDGLANVPVPWVLHQLPSGPLETGASMSLVVNLAGSANAAAAHVVGALEAGANRLEHAHGLILTGVAARSAHAGEDVWRPVSQEGAQWPASVPPSAKAMAPVPRKVQVRLLSPLRLRVQGRYLTPESFHVGAFCMAIIRRLSLLQELYGSGSGAPDFSALKKAADGLRLESAALRWHEQARRSNRQARRVPLGGVVGSFSLVGELAALWPWLVAGQALHVGKAASMGLGRYMLHSETATPR